jgi:hypothetical protein
MPLAAPTPVVLDGAATVLAGRFEPEEHKTYRVLPIVVPEGTRRIEVGYRWAPEHDTVLDLGLWDAAGYRAAEGFRGWSGSRAARQHQGEAPIWVEATAAARCYRAGVIEPGVWWIELGVGEVSSAGPSPAGTTPTCTSTAATPTHGPRSGTSSWPGPGPRASTCSRSSTM